MKLSNYDSSEQSREQRNSAKIKKGKYTVNYLLNRSLQSEYRQSQGKCLLKERLCTVFC